VLAAVDPVGDGVQLKLAITIEVEGAPRPAAVVEALTRLYA
jgi:hypothetical protein